MLAMAGEAALDGSIKPMNETTDATAVFAPLWKRKWLILAVAILVAAGSYLYYRHQPSIYSATTQVYLGNGAEEQSQVGASGSGAKKASALNPTTQAALINSSVIKEARSRSAAPGAQNPRRPCGAEGQGESEGQRKERIRRDRRGSAQRAWRGAARQHHRADLRQTRERPLPQEVEDAIALARRQLRRIEAGPAPIR